MPEGSTTDRLTPRKREIVTEARALLEEHGAGALTMRALADRLGIKAPSLYKHFPDKAALELELIVLGLEETAEALEAAADSLPSLMKAYQAYALAHPHLYRLNTERALPREKLPEGLEARAAAPLLRVCGGDVDTARAAWAFAHGMVILQLNGRFPDDADLSAAWETGADAFEG
ncbi:TetR/AcrR family transcriptional regulator [Streptomyces indicus]|uniref:WHG domain-containing protein n=1 Tax=Streptomyces indicus TaxID=417292 RepID=A0A1G8YIN9_9ACTN|nr:TetR/AcrR family transcriptional regulator [Streptomyces indicus]SDK02611.1 WHG domain-containing protein [Streptomyces indicus]